MTSFAGHYVDLDEEGAPLRDMDQMGDPIPHKISSSSAVTRWLPEGLPGDFEREFDFAQRQCLMLRAPGMLLCRLLDEFAAQENGSAQKPMRITRPDNEPTIHVSGLTDRPEWRAAHLRVRRFGEDLVNKELWKDNKPAAKKLRGKTHAMGERVGAEVEVEGLVQTILTDKKTPFPRQILITGTL